MNSMLIKMAISYAMNRLKEASTWASFAAVLAGSFHMHFTGDLTTAFISFGLAFTALLGVIIKEQAKP
jgi:hypothetical protein